MGMRASEFRTHWGDGTHRVDGNLGMEGGVLRVDLAQAVYLTTGYEPKRLRGCGVRVSVRARVRVKGKGKGKGKR